MIHLRISCTKRSPHPSSEWTRVQDETHRFPTMAAAHAFLAEQYAHVKTRKRVWQDRVGMKPMQTGWIYCYKDTRDISHGDMRTVYCQDWVTFCRVDYRAIDCREKDLRNYNPPPVKES